jgi:hypothetical protein
MKSWTPPTADELQKVALLAGRPENRAYFFDRLNNPLWVGPLRERGFFRDPPDPVPAGDPGYVRFPPWPEGRYLARIASQNPEAVAEVLAETNASENPAVTRCVLEALTELPDRSIKKLAPKVMEWVGAPFADFFDDAAADAAIRLLEMGAVRRGARVAATLLALEPDPRLAEKAATDETPFRRQLEPTSRLADWEYGRIAERLVAPLVDRAGIAGMCVFASLLDEALGLSSWPEEGSPDAFSHIWRPAIEDHEQNTRAAGLRDVLTSVLRDAAVRLSSRIDVDVAAVVQELESRSLLHRRIALFVLAMTNQGSALAAERISRRELFDDYRLRREYATLLRRRFADTPDEVQRLVVGWIADGPDLDAYRRRRTELEGSSPPEDEVSRHGRIWRRDWYSFIAGHLPATNAREYRQLVEELGEPEHADFLSWSSSWTGPVSPVEASDLMSQTPEEVVQYLRDWTPEDHSRWHAGPSVEGLARVFADVVKGRADAYAQIGQRLTALDPTYVRNYFSGLESALREGGTFQWSEPLALAAFVAEQPFEPDEDLPDQDRDPGWRWCRRAIGSLLRVGFGQQAAGLPFHLREAAWNVVALLANDPNPTPTHEDRYGGENMDAFTLSLNTNRGTAMHAVVEYALWVHRHLESSGKDVTGGFNVMPEVRDVLELHLDPDHDRSLAVRSVYGRWLPWLLLLDSGWTEAHVAMILPTQAEYSALRGAAWDTYITWCPPFDSVFRTLVRYYEGAVRRVPSNGSAGPFARESVDVNLGEHLVTLYWRGVADATIVGEFFERSDDELAGAVMEFVGRTLYNSPGDAPAAIGDRIQTLWDERFAVIAADPPGHTKEGRAFGVTFASGKLDPDWSVERLQRAISLVGAPRPGHLVVARLVEVARADPRVAVRILAAMLENSENEWDHLDWKDEARTILTELSGTSDSTTTESRDAVIDYFVRRGELDFRDLTSRPRA